MRRILHLLGTKIAVFGSLVRNRWAMTAFFVGVLVLKRIRNIVFGAGVLGMWLVVPWAHGDVTLSTLLSFDGANGSEPWDGLVQGRDCSFYGTTSFCCAYGYGTVFRITQNGLFKTLHFFDHTTGDNPYGGLVEGVDGNFYGTTSSGGRLFGGTVFKLTPSGLHTELASFSYRGTNGLDPFSALLQGRDGDFYGTTTQGGASCGDPTSVNGQGFGTLFKITPGGKLTTLFSFYGTNGAYPYASLTEGVDGN